MATTIYGVDFTSRPRPAKPIVCAVGILEADTLMLGALERFHNFAVFEAFLRRHGPWIVGVDFPFGLPRIFLAELGWPRTWEGYVRHVAAMSQAEFERILIEYKATHASGEKEPRRQCDILAAALSPLKLHRAPVAKMFYSGAPRLLYSPATILPFLFRDPERVVVEAYPALIARIFLGRQSYKSERRGEDASRLPGRKAIVQGLHQSAKECYGFAVQFDTRVAKAAIADASGDSLDASLCAIQAACAWRQREKGYGIPKDADLAEGFIVGVMRAVCLESDSGPH